MSDNDRRRRELGGESSGSARAASCRVVDRVAAAEETDPRGLHGRLYDAVDPDALDRIIAEGSPDLTVEFRFTGYRVRVRGDGSVSVAASTRE